MKKVAQYVSKTDDLSQLGLVDKLVLVIKNIFKTSSLNTREAVSEIVIRNQVYISTAIRKLGKQIDMRQSNMGSLEFPIKYYQYLDETMLNNLRKYWDIKVKPATYADNIEDGKIFYIIVSRKEQVNVS